MSQACAGLFNELRAYKRSRALAVAFTSGLVDAVREHASTARIAAACGLPEDWACSLLAFLADLSVVERSGGRWILTSMGKAADADESLRAFAGYHLHCYEAWQALPECARRATGGGFHRRAMADPEFARSYILSMEAIARRALPFLEKECHLNGDVLDVGAGPSTFCRHLASSGRCRVTALDLPPMVEAAKKSFDYPAGFSWVGVDFREYVAEKKFDGVFCSHLLEYASVSEMPSWLTRLHTFVRPGGTTAFLVFLRKDGSPVSPDLDLFELSTGVNGDQLGHVCTPEEFEKVLHDAGATEIEFKPLPAGPSYAEFLVTCKSPA